MIQERILELTEYGLVTGLVEPEDRRFTINRLLELFHLDELDPSYEISPYSGTFLHYLEQIKMDMERR